jgi:hypothetical protein
MFIWPRRGTRVCRRLAPATIVDEKRYEAIETAAAVPAEARFVYGTERTHHSPSIVIASVTWSNLNRKPVPTSPDFGYLKFSGAEFVGRHYLLNSAGKPVGYGSALANNSGCGVETVPGTPVPGQFPTSSSGFLPGSLTNCAANTSFRYILPGDDQAAPAHPPRAPECEWLKMQVAAEAFAK